MAVSGFEGFEKRLELQFSGDDPSAEGHGLGLRWLGFESLEKVLHAVQCTVVSAVANHYFDSYVLSESSLFVYPNKIIIKTCGTTQLLKSIRPLLIYAADLGLTLSGCRYTRGNFIFPKSQPYPHTNFREEISFLEANLPNSLIYRNATVMANQWHVFTASDHVISHVSAKVYTIEVCMTELDPVLARKFFRRPGDENPGEVAGKEMTFDNGGDYRWRGEEWTSVKGAVEHVGLRCRSCTADEFPAAGRVVFQTFATRRK
ncbi:adenosylmethionine decarboxylase family protein [Actinidia rufa]|uniref:Adenosylmethionine decarboxylase family protein n=1 Tax=Actinidia rufa TaxID=165716 RepID=A0A7J0EFM8_9ERIC|nr:adenosylmethionine decarboxylase family protein [Actinidia rufa]